MARRHHKALLMRGVPAGPTTATSAIQQFRYGSNRRVVAMRAAKEEHPDDPRFKKMPAWLIDKKTPEHVIQDLLNEIHLGSVRGWAPYEKALQMRALVKSGLIEAEVAERYRMTANEVRAQIEAANLMDKIYFPITRDPADPEHRSKFSYFLEFIKNGRIQGHCEAAPELPRKFAKWVRDGRVNTGMRVRRLPKILDSEEAKGPPHQRRGRRVQSRTQRRQRPSM